MPKGIPNKRYAPEFKKKVVETIINEGMRYRENHDHHETEEEHPDISELPDQRFQIQAGFYCVCQS